MTPQEIVGLFASRTPQPDWAFHWCRPSDTGKWTHDYHRYPAKFIPQLAERLFDEFLPEGGTHVNDPFMGSGTTIVTAVSRGLRASGTDVNAIAHLVTRVKATPIRPDYLEGRTQRLLSELAFLDAAGSLHVVPGLAPLIPERHLDRINYWFPERTRDELGVILRAIGREEDAVARDFFRVAFSHILKNCSRWLQDSTKPTRDPGKAPAKPLPALRRHLAKMLKGNEAFYRAVPPDVRDRAGELLNIRLGDARQQPAADESVDLVVTSSPYVTSYEYADLHQLSTIWLGLADDLRAYKAGFIGSARKAHCPASLRSSIAEDIVARLARVDHRIALEVRGFFADMEQVFDETHRILRPGGRCCYVIGNTRLRGVDILNAQCFAEAMQAAGLRIHDIIVREIPLKILPQTRDSKSGRFASNASADVQAYPIEFILVGVKD